MHNATYRDMTGPNGLIANRQEFRGNSMRAEWTSMCPAAGRLDPEEHDRLHADWLRSIDRNERMYVVYSYATPIAWTIGNAPAYCTPQRFSVTTSKGQGYVRAWIDTHATPLSEPAANGGTGWALYMAERERLGV